jgi:hypothetical protein
VGEGDIYRYFSNPNNLLSIRKGDGNKINNNKFENSIKNKLQ